MIRAQCDIPRRIICLTEESVETLALLGRLDLVIGVSIFVKRPPEAQNLPKVSAFTSSQIEKIVELRPDLVLGFSDIQKDIARDLIGAGLNVWIANHRSLSETLDYILMLARIVGEEDKAIELIDGWRESLELIHKEVSQRSIRPKIYFEEWDEPQISAIQWVSELIELCGGVDIFSERSREKLAKGRFCQSQEVIDFNPDIIFGCWCGKKVKVDQIKKREGWDGINAVKNNQVFELPPEIFLQPGPALFEDGITQMFEIIKRHILQSHP